MAQSTTLVRDESQIMVKSSSNGQIMVKKRFWAADGAVDDARNGRRRLGRNDAVHAGAVTL